jgi:hypothetical protein
MNQRTRPGLWSLAVCTAFTSYASGAFADEQAAPGARVVVVTAGDRLPVPYVDRGITNPQAILSPEVDPTISHVNLVGAGADAVGTAGLSAGYSVTDDFGLRATLFVLQFNDPFRLASGAMGATYRFIRGDFELGLALDWIYQANNFSPGQIIVPSVPMHIHFGHRARLDITPSLPLSTAGIYIPPVVAIGGGDVTLGMDVPLQLSIQLLDQLHIGVGTGFSLTFNPGSSDAQAPPNPGAFLHGWRHLLHPPRLRSRRGDSGPPRTDPRHDPFLLLSWSLRPWSRGAIQRGPDRDLGGRREVHGLLLSLTAQASYHA